MALEEPEDAAIEGRVQPLLESIPSPQRDRGLLVLRDGLGRERFRRLKRSALRDGETAEYALKRQESYFNWLDGLLPRIPAPDRLRILKQLLMVQSVCVGDANQILLAAYLNKNPSERNEKEWTMALDDWGRALVAREQWRDIASTAVVVHGLTVGWSAVLKTLDPVPIGSTLWLDKRSGSLETLLTGDAYALYQEVCPLSRRRPCLRVAVAPDHRRYEDILSELYGAPLLRE